MIQYDYNNHTCTVLHWELGVGLVICWWEGGKNNNRYIKGTPTSYSWLLNGGKQQW